MTNTRLTDPEILEFRYPVLLEDFHIRKGSGGRGEWNAGDGIRRTIRFLEKMECTILSGHRRVPPFGLAGGGDGQIGENWVRRNDGRMEKLKGCDATIIDAGEAIIIQTPTAGGYGVPPSRRGLIYELTGRLARYRIPHVRRVALPIEGVIGNDAAAVGQRQNRIADDLIFGR